MKSKLVICNKAHTDECPMCSHSVIHSRRDMGANYCTEWSECSDGKGNILFKVRCISIESSDGKDVLKTMKKKGKEY